MRILALDLGTHTGWALWQDGYESSGTWDLAPARQRRFEGGGMRWVRLGQFLREIGRVDRVVVEEVRRHAGVDAAHAYGGALATVTRWCEVNKIPYEGIPIGTWKKRLCGSGNASKDMVLAAVRMLGFAPSGYDEADAIAVLLFAVEAGL
jgi:hypothetical protein